MKKKENGYSYLEKSTFVKNKTFFGKITKKTTSPPVASREVFCSKICLKSEYKAVVIASETTFQ